MPILDVLIRVSEKNRGAARMALAGEKLKGNKAMLSAAGKRLAKM